MEWLAYGLLALIGVLMMLPSRLSELDAGESSAAGRVDAWYSGLEMFLQSPLFGIGPGLFADNNANLTAHNSFVLVMAEMGLVGYTIWLAFVVTVGISLRWLQRRGPGDVGRAVVTMIAAIALLDGLFLAGSGRADLALVALLCFAATLALQRWVRGT